MGILTSILAWLASGALWMFERLLPYRLRPQALVGRLRRASNLATDQAFERPKPFSWRTFFRRLFHVLLVVAVVIALYYLNGYLELDLALRSPTPFHFLHRFWLPLLFLLLYATAWVARWLYRLLGPDTPTNEFPDIDDAWAEAMAALDRAGLDPTNVPLFLVFGRPAGSWDSLFAASGLPLLVRNVPDREDAPLRVFAGRDGVFVTCEGASLLGRQATLLTEAQPDPSLANPSPTEAPEQLPLDAVPMSGEAVTAPQLPAGTTAAVPALAMPSFPPDSIGAMMLAGGTGAAVGVLEPAVATTPESAPLPVRQLALLKRTDEVKRLTARLEYLCRRIAHRRAPYCPVNGMLWVLPLAATALEAEAGQIGVVCQRDRQAARERLQVVCPSYVLVCDAERLPGFATLLEHVPPGPLRQRLLGPSFPLLPDLSADRERELVPLGIDWLCRTFFPTAAHRLFRLEGRDEADRWGAADDNARLVQLLGELRDRREPLTRVLQRGFPPEPGVPPLLGGCYLAATGADADQQAFAAGVFQQLVANQNSVAWVAEAVGEERDFNRLTRLGYTAMLVLIVVLIVVGFLMR